MTTRFLIEQLYHETREFSGGGAGEAGGVARRTVEVAFSPGGP
jgi:hypothetical protein